MFFLCYPTTITRQPNLATHCLPQKFMLLSQISNQEMHILKFDTVNQVDISLHGQIKFSDNYPSYHANKSKIEKVSGSSKVQSWMTRLTSLKIIYKPTTIWVIEPCRKVSFSANNKTVVSPSFGTEGAQKYSGIKKLISKQIKQSILLITFLFLILLHNQTGSNKNKNL